MTGTFMKFRAYRPFVPILTLLALALIAGGCRSSKQAAVGEGFFEPRKSVSRPSATTTLKVADAQKPSQSDQMTDSLLSRQREHERRIGILDGQLQLLQTSRKGSTPDSAKRDRTQPVRVSQPGVQPTSGKYEEILRQYDAGQYKSAADGFRGLLQSGVPKDVEDQYHYMIGMSRFKLRQFDLASASLKIVTGWTGSKLRADAYYVLGQIYRELGAGRQAKSMFEAVLKFSPKADLAEAARKELKALAAKK